MKSTDPQILNESLIPWLGKTMKLIDHSIEDLFVEKNIDLTKAQFVLLRNIEKHEGLSQQELAFFVNRNKSTLTRMLATLEKKQFITKTYSKEDKRKFKVQITSEGKASLAKAYPYLTKFVKRLEQGISNQEKKQFTYLLNKIQDNVIGESPTPFFKTTK
ncbi:MarR family winged helix-turn-helix transcriptional regulator [Ochrovirga pacifica]|uniref:MarR family winged helix-turn-helix transcriptional regulator n=1 Tax=Ochrovirga pacifica TaxID=1042376 RepID=UPI00025597E9|nr:MarR family transcriptional regulator [Ochrovirga pacifica]